MDRTIRFGKAIYKHNLAVTLNDPEGIRQIRGPWYSRHETLQLWIIGPPIFKVLLFLFKRLRAIRNHVTDYNSLPRWNCPNGTHVRWSGTGRMVLYVPMCCPNCLPDPVQVRMSIERPWHI
ncbi:MAG: hypothetical protein CL484_08240 [Acidobacteria bacterium]|nr:hypothetical protein [Acidobacteriota bacterium]